MYVNKFGQNEELKQKLFSTGDKKLGNASSNLHYGTGIVIVKKDALDRKKWTGKNIIGKALMTARDILRKQRDKALPTGIRQK